MMLSDGQGNDYGLLTDVGNWVHAGITDIGIPILYQVSQNRFTFFQRVSSRNIIGISIDGDHDSSIYVILKYTTAVDNENNLGKYAGWKTYDLPIVKDYRALVEGLKEFIKTLDISGELYI